ncbi:M4 family metallopeptidase [Paraglaciecola sp.]|uniref:M4 family metallopeptidase n=1 Tax=Paraglaciecola sp. TaxID=1920173 RepID=UPI0030F4154F
MSNYKKTVLSLAAASSLFTLQTTAAERINLEQQMLQGNGVNIQSLLTSQGVDTFRSAAAPTVGAQNLISSRPIRLKQYYKGVEVYGVSVAAQPQENNTFINVSGTYASNIDGDLDSIDATFSVVQAVDQILSQSTNKLTRNDVYNIESKLHIWLDGNDVAHLAWLISYVDTTGEPSRPHFFIDANTGEVLEQWEGMTFVDGTGPGGNLRTGRYEFGPNGTYSAFQIMGSGNTCRLDSPNVVTYDMNHQKTGGNVHTFPCYENTARQVNGSYSALNDAHAFGQATFDMYKDWYNKAPLTQKLKMRVHYDRYFENAFWDGQQMTFGDGQNVFHPLVDLGVVAHEVSHGFTQQNSNLQYVNQSGGLNESFSDIAAAGASYYLTGSFSWQIGDKIKKGSGAMRYMDVPSRDGRSIDNASQYRSGMDVHHSSGVFNRSFYLLSTTSGWTIRKAFDVYVSANQTYWNANETFDSAGRGVYKAAKALGYCVDDVLASLTQVGVNNSGPKDGSGCGSVGNVKPTANYSFQVNELSVTFTNSSSDDKAVVSHQWNFGDGSSSSQVSPVHVYAADGTYAVSLTVADAEGLTDVKTAQVSVKKGGNNTGCDGVNAWSASTSYVVGNIVSYNNYRYEAIWWSTGAKPDVFSNVWKNLGKCSGNGGNQAPSANFSHSANKLTVTFTDSSTDDKGVVSHSWNFGDGSSDTLASPIHTYASDGSYNVQLTVMDAEGESNTKSKTVTVSKGGTGTCTAPAWSASKVYNTGDKASQNGKEYQANWWSQNQSPANNSGQWAVWTLVANCP